MGLQTMNSISKATVSRFYRWHEHLPVDLKKEIPGLKVESEQVANEARQLTGELPF